MKTIVSFTNDKGEYISQKITKTGKKIQRVKLANGKWITNSKQY